MSASGVKFNSIDLEDNLTPNFRVTSRDVQSIPQVTIEQYPLIRFDGQKFVNVNYPTRKIVIDGIVSGNQMAGAEANLDSLKSLLTPQDSNLDLNYAGSVRRWVATMTNLISQVAIGAYLAVSIEFSCSDPIGKDTSNTSPSFSTITTATSTQSVTYAGTYLALPAITAVLNSGTGLTSQSITISNPATAQGITVTRTWTATDSLVIDCLNRTVKVNGTAVNFTGAFPYWSPVAGTISYVDTFTTRNVTLTTPYQKRYL